MIAVIDNDVILKLARWDLLPELLDLLGGSPVNIRHLPTCVYALCGRPSRMIKTGCDAASADRIRAFCQATIPLHPILSIESLETLSDIPEIDEGEVQIFAIASEDPNAVTYIGDKRSLMALANIPKAKPIAVLLEGRVKCLEQVMGELVLLRGVGFIGGKISACNPPADKATTLAFIGRTGVRSESEIWEGLRSYYLHLQGLTGNLLAPFPEFPVLASPI